MEKILPVNLSEIPDELKEKAQWFNWVLKPDPKNKNTKPSKIPLNANKIKHPASVTDPSTYAAFDTAVKNLKNKNIAGLGFCLTNLDEFVVIDIDHCVNKDGELHSMAWFWVQLFNSYTEVSPSGTGIHIFVKGDAIRSVGNGKKTNVKDSASGLGFEIYCTKRFFTITGQILLGYWEECGAIKTTPGVIELFFNTYFKQGKRSGIWKPIDGKMGEGDRNNTMQRLAGHLVNQVVDLLEPGDVEVEEGSGYAWVTDTILRHYNSEYTYPPLTDKEMGAHTRSIDKYLDDKLSTLEEDDEEYSGVTEKDLQDDSDVTDKDNVSLAKAKIDKYVFVMAQNKYLNTHSGKLQSKDAVNIDQGNLILKIKVKGKYIACKLTTFLQHQSNALRVDDLAWHPGMPKVIYKGKEELAQAQKNNKNKTQWKGEVLYNTYKPINFNVLPSKAGRKDIPLYIELLEHVIKEKELRDHFLDFLAFTLQRPEQKINYGVLLISEYEGVGKDLLLIPLRKILGGQYQAPGSDLVKSNFNEYLNKTKMLIIEEIEGSSYQDKITMMSTLKPILASPPDELTIDVKKQTLIRIANVVSVILLSNRKDAILIRRVDTSRRVYAINSDATPLPLSFYDDYFKEIENNRGWAKVVRWLLDRDISEFNYQKAPKTQFLEEIAIDSRSNLHQRLIAMEEEGKDSFSYEFLTSNEVDIDLDQGLKLSLNKLVRTLKDDGLGFHCFNVPANGVPAKAYVVNGIRKLCKVMVRHASPRFKIYAGLTAQQLNALHEMKLKRDDERLMDDEQFRVIMRSIRQQHRDNRGDD